MNGKLSDLVKVPPPPTTSNHPSKPASPMSHGTPSAAWQSKERNGIPPEPQHRLAAPPDFNERYVMVRNAAYQCWHDGRTNALTGGVLPAGDTVWASAHNPERSSQRSMLVFSERIGFVLIDAHALRRQSSGAAAQQHEGDIH